MEAHGWEYRFVREWRGGIEGTDYVNFGGHVPTAEDVRVHSGLPGLVSLLVERRAVSRWEEVEGEEL